MNRQFEIKIDEAIRKNWPLFTGNADSGFNIMEILTLALPEYCTVDKPIMCSSFLDEGDYGPQGIEMTDEWEAGFEITWHWDRWSGMELSHEEKKEIMKFGLHALEIILDSHGRYGRKSYPAAVLEDLGPSLWFDSTIYLNSSIPSYSVAGVRYCFDDSTR